MLIDTNKKERPILKEFQTGLFVSKICAKEILQQNWFLELCKRHEGKTLENVE